MDAWLEGLNPAQRRAVEQTEGPVLVLAGAGSGKTRTLTHRMAHLVRGLGVAPDRILAFTFTNKAANEMRQRVQALMDADARGMWIGTFHATAVRILREGMPYLGRDPHFLVYDADDARAVMRDVVRELNWDERQWTPQSLLAAVSRAKNQLLTPDRLDGDTFLSRRVREAYARYQQRLQALNAVDFDDLIMLAVELLEKHPEARARLAGRFQYVLVDEYQDTNHAQYRLIRALAAQHRNLCCVGDDDQSIYGWRGADIRNILDFQKDFPDAVVVRLEENYRSTPTILAAANAVVRHNTDRMGKELWTRRPDGRRVRLFEAVDEEAEAWFVAQAIHDLIREGRRTDDVAVLYRTNAQSRALELALSRAGIPYRLVGGPRFYERREVKDLIAYLRVIYNPGDDMSLARIVNVPRRGIGEVAVQRLRAYAADRGVSLAQALAEASQVPDLAPPAARAARELHQRFEGWRRRTGVGLVELVQAVAEESGLVAQWRQEHTAEGDERLANIAELVSEAKRFEDQTGSADLGDFLGWIALATDLDSVGEADRGVWLMTLHSAKGLEFPVVFLTGLEEGILPHAKAIEDGQVEEERRLMYVGITRAQDLLVLTYARQRLLNGRPGSYPVSRFVQEIPAELVEVLAREIDRPAVLSRTPPADGFQAGDRVRHPRFGWGTVVAARGSGDDLEVTVAFPGGGIRSLLARYAQLEREEA
ncbi:MAG: UvrD-helicase domain-containing protein [Actinomycetia bacterium]|nr:UvrD-helicase domain-containing protein [Actinomycetes bacterium]